MKKTITSFSPRAAMILLATMLLTLTAQTAWAETVDLSTVTANKVLQDGDVVTGILDTEHYPVKISIADGATVTLNGVTINGIHDNNNANNYDWAGISCEGDATIILADGTTNTVKGFRKYMPAIHVPQGKTLTIQGNGALEASNNGEAAGIGCGNGEDCGNIVIKGGIITAIGGNRGTGIGVYGTIYHCGNITIEKGVTYLKATNGPNATNGIGAYNADYTNYCGKVTLFDLETGSISGEYTYDASINYTVKFDNNGGTGSMDDLSLSLGEPIILPKYTFTRTNYLFAGWSTTANGDVEYLDEQMVMSLATTDNAIVTLYAVWKEPSETITPSSGAVRLLVGQTLSGQGGENTHVTIADGATVTLSGVNITSIPNDTDHSWAGITCEGDATIILEENSTNAVKGGYNRPGIYVPTGKTLTIQGSGALESTGVGYAAGIGAGKKYPCGNIVIKGGSITATAQPGQSSAAIGGTHQGNCGDITIEDGVTYVEATKSSSSNTYHCIGAGASNACGKVTVLGFEEPVTESPYIIDKSIKYTIQFHSNGGTGSMPVFSLILGKKIFLPKHTFTRTNYYFAGWSTTADGDVDYLDEQAVMNLATTNNAIVTLYAVWKEPNEAITSSSGTVRLLDGQTLSGQGGENTHVTIADGATVTLNGVTITSITNDADHSWAGITCEGDATIILEENSTNAVKGGYERPGIYVPAGKTLTIQGSGALAATGVGYAAGIGGNQQDNCGNIIIEGGNITAMGGSESAGIGAGSLHSCGDITISGGTINATGGDDGAGIGAAFGRYDYQNSSCGNITISGGSITANGGKYAAGIGAGMWHSTCGNIIISTTGSVTATGGKFAAGIGTGDGRNEGTLSSECGNITILSGNFVVTKGDDATHSIGVGRNGTCGIVTIAGVEGYISTSPYTQNIVSDNYTVHFEANGGNGTMSDQSIYCGIETPLSRNTFANDGYAFIGWSTTVGGDVTYTDCYKVTDLAEKDGSITLYAKWMSTTGIPAGLQVDAEYTQSEDGFYYVKILTDELSTPATTTIVIDNPQYYTFKIYDNGGKNSDYSVIYQWESGLLTIQAPECYKIVLNGSADYHQAKLILYDDVTENNEKKIWEQVSYLHGSIGTQSSTGRYLTIKFNPSYASYYGAGLDLTATIVPYSYTVSFNKNNDAATGTMEDQTHTWNATLALTANTFECTGYTFAGWATSADGDVVYNDAEEVSNICHPGDANIELFAKWKELPTNTEPVSYITATGISDTKAAGTVYVLDGTEDELGTSGQTTWYIVPSTATGNNALVYVGWLKLHGDVHLILADGSKMTVGDAEFGASALNAVGSGQLTIYGQTNGTGELNVISGPAAISVPDNALTICGGVVNVEANTAFNGKSLVIYGGKFTTIGANNNTSITATNVQINGGEVSISGSIQGTGDVEISGGKVDVSGNIQSTSGDIILGWTNASDHITAVLYQTNTSQDHNVKIADGKVLKYTDGTVKLLHTGIVAPSVISGKELTPYGIFGYCGKTSENGGKNVYWSIALNDDPETDAIYSNTLVIEKNTNILDETNFDMANYSNDNASVPGNFAPWIKPNAAGNKSDGLKYPITAVTIADGVTSIGNEAFENCSGLQNVTIGNTVTSIGNQAFDHCSGLQIVTIGNSVTSIGNQAFDYCSGLQKVNIGNSVTTISNCAFRECRGLQEVNIGSSVTTIDGHAFENCRELQNVTIPASVTTINGDAFRTCINLTVITMRPSTPPSLQNSDVFRDCDLKLILVPNEKAYTAYNGAGEGWDGKISENINTSPEDITYKSLLAPSVISLAKNTSGWGTYCHRYPVSYSLSEGATAYTLSGLYDDKTAVTIQEAAVTIEETDVNAVAPLTPLLLNYTAPDNDTETDDETVTLTALPATATTVSDDIIVSNGGIGWSYYGNATGTTQTHNPNSDPDDGIPALTGGWPTYILRNGTFVLVDTDEGIPAHRCVLSIGSSNAARVLTIGTGDETTGIEELKNGRIEELKWAGAWYSLDGRKLDKQPTKKGLYIYNGKKTVIK